MNDGTANLNEIAEAVIKRLRGKVVIHRYDAYSTNSIYLKFDYGVANSLRISDHPGKQYLKYRYNILCGTTSKKVKRDGGFERIFYSPDMIRAVCRDILEAKEQKKERYKNYNAVMEAAAEKSKHEAGFWQGAKEIV